MKGKLLGWLLLMILSSLALTINSFHLENHRNDVNLSKAILHGQETIQGVLGTVRLNGFGLEGDYGRGNNKEQEGLVVTEKGKRGKTGVSGGGGSTRRPHRERSSATPRPYLIVKTILHVGFSLVLILSFQ